MGGLFGEYFDRESYAKGSVVVCRVDPTVDFSWGRGSPHEKVPKDGFSCHWSGWLRIPADGSYTLLLHGYHAATLMIGGEMVMSARKGWETKAMELKAGFHPIDIRQRTGSDPAHVKLWWKVRGQAGPVPRQHLYFDMGKAKSALQNGLLVR